MSKPDPVPEPTDPDDLDLEAARARLLNYRSIIGTMTPEQRVAWQSVEEERSGMLLHPTRWEELPDD